MVAVLSPLADCVSAIASYTDATGSVANLFWCNWVARLARSFLSLERGVVKGRFTMSAAPLQIELNLSKRQAARQGGTFDVAQRGAVRRGKYCEPALTFRTFENSTFFASRLDDILHNVRQSAVYVSVPVRAWHWLLVRCLRYSPAAITFHMTTLHLCPQDISLFLMLRMSYRGGLAQRGIILVTT